MFLTEEKEKELKTSRIGKIVESLLEGKTADGKKFAEPLTGLKRDVMSIVLENQKIYNERGAIINEAAPTNNYGGGNIASYDPILMGLVRRAYPNLMSYDVMGVQPMTGPSGQIFALRSRYTTMGGTEALYQEPDTYFSGTNSGSSNPAQGTDPLTTGFPPVPAAYHVGTGMTTAAGESLGDGTNGNDFNEMALSIEKVLVSAEERALRASYSTELAQDMKAVHGLDAQAELSNILAAEILAEINRQGIRSIYLIAKTGSQQGSITTAGTFDLNIDSDGRWLAEKFKGLRFQIEREANKVAKETRLGRGNIVICSSDVASALAMTGALDYAPAMASNLQVDDTGNTFAGTLSGGRIKVYIDPYFDNGGTDEELLCVGFKGASPYAAGLFYCPYIPLIMYSAFDPRRMQPVLAFKSRQGFVVNPYYRANLSQTDGSVASNKNLSPFYRLSRVKGIG